MRRDEWQRALRVANQAFGIAPGAFWRMSLSEWRALVSSESGTQAPTRTELERMMAGWEEAQR
ncbi:MAG TPA: phage tail assembly chaperone [Micropepsaceae bacterium]|nr:phage tail assembly chaperone [Micropepsaceae bacterium]